MLIIESRGLFHFALPCRGSSRRIAVRLGSVVAWKGSRPRGGEVESRCRIGDGSPALCAALQSSRRVVTAAAVVAVWPPARPMQAARCCCAPPQPARTRRVRGLWPLPVPVAACLPACRSFGLRRFRVCSHRGAAASSLIAAGPFVSPSTFSRKDTRNSRVPYRMRLAGGFLPPSSPSSCYSTSSAVVARKLRGD